MHIPLWLWFRSDGPIEKKLVRGEQGYVPTGTVHSTVISICYSMQRNHPDPKQEDTRLAVDRPRRAIGDGGQSSAFTGPVWRAADLAIDAVPAVRRDGDHDRVRADCSRPGSAAAMVVWGVAPEPAPAPRRRASGNRARGAAIAGLSPASLATPHGPSESGAP